MTRTKYMKKLEEALAACDSELRNEILAGYEEHFRNGLLAGKTEAEICKELGDIDEFIKEIPAEYNVLPANTDANPIETQNYENEYPKKYYAEGIDTVIIESKPSASSSANISIAKSDDHTIGIDGPTYEESGFKCIVSLENNTCHIDITSDKPIITSILQKIFKHSEADFKIYIPRSITNLTVASQCGNMSINDCNIATAKFAGSSGDGNISNCSFDNLQFTSSNGDIEVSVVQANIANITTSNGDIDISTINADTLHAQSSNGDVAIANVGASKVCARSSNGDVDVAGSFEEITAASSNGDVDVISFNNCPSVDIKSSMGDVNYECKNGSGFVASCKTSMGDRDVSYKGHIIKKGEDKLYHAGDESATINMSTSMGDVCING